MKAKRNTLFAERITEARKKKKLTQGEVSKLLQIDIVTYGRYERNLVKPSIEVAAQIADFFNISLDYLVGKSDYKADEDILKRMEAISKLPEKQKEVVRIFLDAFLTSRQ